VQPEFSLPACYNVSSALPQQQKIQNLTEETLFYIFYTMPKDSMQEAAAVELTNRNWRYHKELQLWLTKDPLSEPIQQTAQAESGIYIFFDPTTWMKVKVSRALFRQQDLLLTAERVRPVLPRYRLRKLFNTVQRDMTFSDGMSPPVCKCLAWCVMPN
jgi:hypothetical protein